MEAKKPSYDKIGAVGVVTLVRDQLPILRHHVTDASCLHASLCHSDVEPPISRLLDTGRLRRVLAQVEVSYSNSMIEAWWRCLKHACLYLHSLDLFSAVEKLVAFYVEQHNTVMPHRAFDGRTPDEVYFGTNANLAGELAARRLQAQASRLAFNRAMTCNTCVGRDVPGEAVPREPA